MNVVTNLYLTFKIQMKYILQTLILKIIQNKKYFIYFNKKFKNTIKKSNKKKLNKINQSMKNNINKFNKVNLKIINILMASYSNNKILHKIIILNYIMKMNNNCMIINNCSKMLQKFHNNSQNRSFKKYQQIFKQIKKKLIKIFNHGVEINK